MTIDAGEASPETTATHLILIGDKQLVALVQTHHLWPERVTGQVMALDALAKIPRRYDPEQVVIVVLLTHLDTRCLLSVNAFCQEHGVRWVSFHLDQGMGWLGPAIVPGYTADYRDLLVRRLTVADEPAAHEAMTAMPLFPLMESWSLLPPQELLWMLSLFFIEVARWLAGQPCHIVSCEMAADPLALTWQCYPVLPLPDHRLQGDLQISEGEDLLLNGRSGIIIRTVKVNHHPTIPKALKTVQAHLAFMPWYDPDWYTDPVCGGSAFEDENQAYQSAIGEAVERYCSNATHGIETIKASYNDLIARGDHAVDPQSLVLFSERMYQTPGCPFVPFTRALPVYWVKGWSLTQGIPAWLPFRLVFVAGDLGEFAQQPLTNPVYVPGVAAGKTVEQALVSGMEELIERDSTMIWWLNRHPLPAMQLTPQLEAYWQGEPSTGTQHAWLIHIPNEFDIPVMAGVVENTQEQLLNIGFACRPDPVQAGLKAWSEALVLQEGSRDLLDPNGSNYRATEAGWLPNALKPWRPDRAYLEDYRHDHRDILYLSSQQQFYLDPRAIERVRPWVNVPASKRLADVSTLPNRSLGTYQQQIETRGYEIFYADITSPDVAHTPFKVVRVIIPGLVPNFPAAFPPIGRGRVQRIPVQLGWRATPLVEDALNYMPMPHA